jgi:hypothetical protein
MKKKYSVEQIVGVLKQAEVGVPVAGLIRETGIAEPGLEAIQKCRYRASMREEEEVSSANSCSTESAL